MMLLFLSLIIISAIMDSQVLAITDPLDVQALGDLYKSLNEPPLAGWKLDGGDPCEESWDGISCYGSSIIRIKLPVYDLTGNLGSQLSNLQSLVALDLSFNNIEGEIPRLPSNLTYLRLDNNKFFGSLENVFAGLENLELMNLSSNHLSGALPNIFIGFRLDQLDLSYNNLTGDLPSSFESLANLTKLFLQSNGFTGSLACLIGLPLTDLNIQDNHFNGVIPEQLKLIPNLWIGGNSFDNGAENHTDGLSVSSPQSSYQRGQNKQTGLTVILVVSGTLLAVLAVICLCKMSKISGKDYSWLSRQSSISSSHQSNISLSRMSSPATGH